MMSEGSGEMGHPCLDPDLGGKDTVYHHSYNVSYSFFIDL